jgi:hypothetical protein
MKETYLFLWLGGAFEKADLVEKEHDKYIRFHWLASPKEEYFEFRIDKSEIPTRPS